MYTRTITQSNRSVTVQINSVIDSNAEVILFRHNRFICNLSFIGQIPIFVEIQGKKFYTANNSSMTLDLSDYIRWPFYYQNAGTHLLFRIKLVFETGVTQFTIPIRDALLGKSYPFRNPVTTYRQIPNGVNTIEIFSPFDGYLQSGNVLVDLYKGLNYIPVANLDDVFFITDNIISTFDETFDHTFRTDFHKYICEIEKPCAITKDAYLIRYKNANGENAYLVGYESELVDKFEGTNYRGELLTKFFKQSKLNMYNTSEELTLVIPNIAYEAFPGDIMLNETITVEHNGTIHKCAPIADSVTRSEEFQDYEIKIKLL